MKLKLLATTLFLAFSVAGFAQSESAENTANLKKQQKILVIEKRLVDNKLKLEEKQKALIAK
ncbi:MAG: hypothetical protein EOO02_01955, partial [Chitinophagaceae bacterium]